MIHFLTKDILYRNITNPLNSGEKHFYSLLSDGSSNAKTMDEKELVLIKTCNQGRPVFHVFGLQEVEEADQYGIANAINCAVLKASFEFDRRDKEVGLCTDRAPVNKAAVNHIQADLDMINDYLHTLCPGHKVELSIEEAFKTVLLNADRKRS